MRILPQFHSALAFILAFVCCPLSSAQTARVISANSSNNRILAVTFDPPGTTQLNTDTKRLKSLRSITIRDDGVGGVHLLACDTLGGKVLFYENSSGAGAAITDGSRTGQPTLPDGLCIDFEQNLFLVSSGTGEAGSKIAQVWTVLHDSAHGSLPGGYRSPLGLLDNDVHGTTQVGGHPVSTKVELLEDSMLMRTDAGVLHTGDLLVLASSPAMLLVYSSDALSAYHDALRAGQTPPELEPTVVIHPPYSSVPAANRFPEGAAPSGMAFEPDGNLLIASGTGSILIYGPEGARRNDGGGFIDFASGLGNGLFKIAVGPQDGGPKAFVTSRNGGKVFRFVIRDDGTGILDRVVEHNVEFPIGITTTTANLAATPRGDQVTVSALDLIETTFETVFVEGFTSAKAMLFEDPREAEEDVPAHLPLHRSLFLNELDGSLPPLEIPRTVRTFRRGDPDTGIPTLILIEAETSAEIGGIVDHFAEVSSILGYEPDCDAIQPSEQSRMFWAPDANDPPILEKNVFIDITVACGSNKGFSRDLSYFLLGVRDTRAVRDIASAKLTALSQVLGSAQCIDRKLRQSLTRKMDSSLRYFEKKQYKSAIDSLESLVLTIEQNSGSFDSCAGHLSSELQARAFSAVFMLGKL